MTEEFELDAIQYSTYARVLETYQQFDEVDDMLAHAASAGEAWVTEVLLGSLVDAAAERRDRQRADEVWKKLVEEHGVEPTIIAYSALAKVHLLCGRVIASLQVMDEAGEEAVSGGAFPVVGHSQLLLLAFHSSPSERNRQRLRRALDLGKATVESERSSRHTVDEWKKITRVAQHLMQGNRRGLGLHDVLIEWKAKTKSAMREWPNHAHGSGYLGEAGGQ